MYLFTNMHSDFYIAQHSRSTVFAMQQSKVSLGNELARSFGRHDYSVGCLSLVLFGFCDNFSATNASDALLS